MELRNRKLGSEPATPKKSTTKSRSSANSKLTELAFRPRLINNPNENNKRVTKRKGRAVTSGKTPKLTPATTKRRPGRPRKAPVKEPSTDDDEAEEEEGEEEPQEKDVKDEMAVTMETTEPVQEVAADAGIVQSALGTLASMAPAVTFARSTNAEIGIDQSTLSTSGPMVPVVDSAPDAGIDQSALGTSGLVPPAITATGSAAPTAVTDNPDADILHLLTNYNPDIVFFHDHSMSFLPGSMFSDANNVVVDWDAYFPDYRP